MNEKPRDPDSAHASQPSYEGDAFDLERRRNLGGFFRAHRLKNLISEEDMAAALELPVVETIMAYESGRLAMPLEDVYAMTNLLNLAPEDVMALIHGLYKLGTD